MKHIEQSSNVKILESWSWGWSCRGLSTDGGFDLLELRKHAFTGHALPRLFLLQDSPGLSDRAGKIVGAV
jgi:hypothetical protein